MHTLMVIGTVLGESYIIGVILTGMPDVERAPAGPVVLAEDVGDRRCNHFGVESYSFMGHVAAPCWHTAELRDGAVPKSIPSLRSL